MAILGVIVFAHMHIELSSHQGSLTSYGNFVFEGKVSPWNLHFSHQYQCFNV